MANRIQYFIRSLLFNSGLNSLRLKEIKNKKNILNSKNKIAKVQPIYKRNLHNFAREPITGFGGGGGGGDNFDILKMLMAAFAVYISHKLTK